MSSSRSNSDSPIAPSANLTPGDLGGSSISIPFEAGTAGGSRLRGFVLGRVLPV